MPQSHREEAEGVFIVDGAHFSIVGLRTGCPTQREKILDNTMGAELLVFHGDDWSPSAQRSSRIFTEQLRRGFGGFACVCVCVRPPH